MADDDDLFDFSHLTPTGTARCTLSGVGIPRTNKRDLVLIGTHAGATNERFTKAFKNASLRGEADDRKLVELFVRTVITGWDHAEDQDGKPLPYSEAMALKLLNRLLDAKRTDIVRAAFNFFSDPDRFTDAPTGDDLGKA